MNLLIVADDLGLCAERDSGIFLAAAAGRISGASLLVNTPGAGAAAEKAVECELSLGLHFNCTEGAPLTAAVPEESFCGKEQTWQRLHHLSADGVAALVLEFEAQCERFEALCGYSPRRFDGHQHIHLHPRLVAPLAEAAQRRGISYTRAMRQREASSEQLNDFYRMLFDVAPGSSAALSDCGLRSADLLLGVSCSFDTVRKALPQAQAQCCELLLHPGYRSEVADEFSASMAREQELQWLLSEEAATQIARCRFVRGLEW